MITIKDYKKASSLEEAYELNQKRTNRIIGGMLWTKMSSANINTVIDISGLGLDKIEENDNEFIIGAMTTLRDIETHKGFDLYTDGAAKEALHHIVGVQFRNLATVGGSVFGRYGFSDVITLFLSLDTYVQLYKGGIIPLAQFINMPYDRDILVNIIVKKEKIRCAYKSVRITKTDFPVLACSAALTKSGVRMVFGARPGKAVLLTDAENIIDGEITEENAEQFAAFAKENIKTGSNMRGSAEYRSHLVSVLAKRILMDMGGLEK